MNERDNAQQFPIVEAVIAYCARSFSNQAAVPVIRMKPIADLKVFDTHVNSIQITKIYALMVYDTLFAWDSHLKPQKQMVESETVSDDRPTPSPSGPALNSMTARR